MISLLNATKKTYAKFKNHTPYAGALLGGIGFLANVAGVAGLVLDHANELVVFASVLAIICGLYLLLKRWGKTVDTWVLLAVTLMLAGSVVLTLALKNRSAHDQLAQEDSSQTTTGTSGHTSDTGGTGTGITVPNVSGNHKVVSRKSLKLLSQEGLDIDDQKAAVLEQQSTAHAPSDIYLSDYPSLLVTVNKFFKYQPPGQSSGNTEKDEYNSCQSLIAHSQLGDRIIVSIGIKPGQQYCLVTTAGKLALMTLQELDDSSNDPSQYSASISVKVWN
jgi:hypothetical protein